MVTAMVVWLVYVKPENRGHRLVGLPKFYGHFFINLVGLSELYEQRSHQLAGLPEFYGQ